jgi:UDPglucose 6-dehydrogenase/UDP-N-acetyl-D-galactosamine dehydrogenase
MTHRPKDKTACIAGLGYVGLPLALAFSRQLPTIGFDVDAGKIRELFLANDTPNIAFTDNPEDIGNADFIIIAVPTPVTKSKDPDLSYIESAARTIGMHLKPGAIVVLESTVYPGVTEEVLKPILEHESGLTCGTDFRIGYSPERINPGDDEHSLERITKIVSGMDRETTEALSSLYGMITTVYEARDIRTAEAAKVIENVQRDLNIALVNELSLIFAKMGLSTDFFTKNRVKTALWVGLQFLVARLDGVIVTVVHDEFRGMGLSGVQEFMDEEAVVVDVRVMFEGE